MKKLVIVLLMLGILSVPLLLAESVEAKNKPVALISAPGSIAQSVTKGIFGNQFDKQFSTGLGFGTYPKPFIYAGLANPLKATAKDSGNDKDFSFGYYMPGGYPMSFYTSFYAATFGKKNKNHSKIEGGITSKTSFKNQKSFQSGRFGFQYMIGLQSNSGVKIVLGPSFTVVTEKDQNYNNNNKTLTTDSGGSSTTQIFENTSLKDKGDLPTTAAEISEKVEIGTGSKFSFGTRLPVAFATGELKHTVEAGFDVTASNRDSLYELSGVGKQKITDRGTDAKIAFKYGISIPSKAENGNWSVATSFDVDIASRKYVKDGSSVAYKHGIGLNASCSAGRRFNFNPADTVAFGLKPNLKLDILANNTLGEHTYAYKSGDKVTNKWFKGSVITASLPMGLKLEPENWKIGFLIGAVPSVAYEIKANTEDKESSNENKFKFSEAHAFGLTVPFGGGVRLEAELGGNLLDFNTFTIQVFIPLGNEEE